MLLYYFLLLKNNYQALKKEQHKKMFALAYLCSKVFWVTETKISHMVKPNNNLKLLVKLIEFWNL